MNTGFRLGTLLLLLVCVSGCLGQEVPRTTRYALDVPREGPAVPLEAGNLRVGRVRVDPLFERKAFVYQTDEGVYESDFYHEFYSPPGILVRRMTEEWMKDSQIFTALLGPSDSRDTHWDLEARVLELYVDLRQPGRARSVIQIEFTLLDATSTNLEVVFRKRYGAGLSVPDRQPRSFVAGWNEGLSEILSSLESDLRAAVASASP